MSTRTVTGTILHMDGTAWVGASVVFELLDLFETTTEIYPLELHTEITDSNGGISTALGVPTTGTAHYRVNLPDSSAYEFNLQAGSTIDLVTLILANAPGVDPAQLQTIVDSRVATLISPIIILSGKVGIGAASPKQKLTIQGTGAQTAFIGFNNSSDTNPYVGVGFDETLDALTIRANVGSNDLNTTHLTILRATGEIYTAKGTWNPYATGTPTSHGYGTLPASGIYRYVKIGKRVTVEVCEPNAGVSNGDFIILDVPFTSATITNMYWYAIGFGIDNGAAISTGCLARIASNSAQIGIFKGADAGLWTTSGNKRANFTLIYETA